MGKKLALVVLLLVPAGTLWGQEIIDPDLFMMARGDANSDEQLNITDVNYINNWLFNGGPVPPCKNMADVNNDGSVTLTDSIYLANFLYNGGSEPPSPGPYNTECAQDDEPAPGCQVSPCD